MGGKKRGVTARIYYTILDHHTQTAKHVAYSPDIVDGGNSGGETPGPIPNPEAKPTSADGTAPARVWESRTPPSPKPLEP